MRKLEYERVSWICPKCKMTCGWDAKRGEFDAVRVEDVREGEMQYAHQRCAVKELGL